jgi:NADPH-dependent curcumin reductase CurA
LRSEVESLYITSLIMPSLPTQNRRVVLAERPNRGPITEKTFKLESAKIGDLEDGQILVKVLYTSIVSLVIND